MNKYSTYRITHKQSVQGATLIEVLVSVFLLTFGILGLMAAQLRSVAAVSESENRNIAAQAAENLAEAMQANPRLNKDGQRSYSDYMIDAGKMKSVEEQPNCSTTPNTIAADSKSACALGKNLITKAELAKAQLGEFQHILKQMPNAVEIRYTVCFDNPRSVKSATVNAANCQAKGTPVIKIVWTTLVDKSSNDDGVPEQEEQSYYLVIPE